MAVLTQRSTEGSSFETMPSGAWTPRQKQLVTGNYARAYRNAPAKSRRLGEQFYPSWHEDAQHIGSVTGTGVAGGAAILAHLSPANEAEVNRIQALQVAHGVSDRQANALIRAGESSAMQTGAVSKRTHALRAGDQPAASHWDREAALHSADVAKFRAKGGIEGTPLGGLGSREIANALKVRSGAHADPLGSLGEMKIRDFGELIHDPHGYSRAPIDTHYHDVGVGRTDIPYIQPRGLGAVGRYEQFQGSHQRARGIVSAEIGEDISHAAFMGGSWYAHQQRKVQTNPDAMRARRASETKIGNIRASKGAQPYLPERFGLRPMFGKIDTGR